METRIVRSACPYDCPDTCGLLIETDGATVVRVKGDPEHPVTRGFVCRKMQRYDRSINHPDRILRPLKRTGGKGTGAFIPIDWEEALGTIAERWNEIINAHGPQAILPYSYSGVMSAIGRHCGNAFFNFMGASGLVRTICSTGKNAGWTALMGATGDLDPRELTASDFIIVWGSDITATRLHTMPLLREARKHGVPITLVETYVSPTGALCDETILIRPGTDGALALSMMRVLVEERLVDKAFLAANTIGWEELEPTLEEYAPETVESVTGIPAATIRRLARDYGMAKAPAIILGTGASRYRNGATNVRCVSLLPAVVGAWGKPGGGLCGVGPVNPSPLNMSAVQRPDFLKGKDRNINMNQLAAALGDTSLSPPVRGLYVYGANPAAVTGNQKAVLEQLSREDLFTVVHERFVTDTARYADIVLPATFSVEQADIHTCYGYCTLQVSDAAVPPPGECRSNWNTFRSLAEAMGYDDPYFRRTKEEMIAHVLDNSPALAATLSAKEWEDLRAGKAVSLPFQDHLRFGTASGKIEIANPSLAHPLPRHIDVVPDAYPLRLVASPSPYTLNSTFNEREDLAEKRGPLSLLLHNADARSRGIEDGARIICFNEQAEVEYIARVVDGILPGTVVAVGVYPLSKSHNGLATNALMRERLSDLGDATTMNDNGVEVRRA